MKRAPAAPFDALGFLAERGVALASARGPVPSLAEAVAGEPIRGSWWGHPRGHDIFRALTALDESPDVLAFKLIAGKVTFVHRRLWPALVRLSGAIGPERLAAIRQEHTATGAHRNVATKFPDWVPADIDRAARALDEATARAQLGSWLDAPAPRRAKRSPGQPRTAAKRRSADPPISGRRPRGPGRS